MTLKSIQQGMHRWLTEGDPAMVQTTLQRGTDQARLRVYSNNCHQSWRRSIRQTFPALTAIVGEAYLLSLARRHRQETTAYPHDLNDYAGDFQQWLQSQSRLLASSELPYLADLAKLEWLHLQSHLASNTPSTPWPGEQEGLDGIYLQRSPHTFCLRTAWPVDSLYQHWQQQTLPDAIRHHGAELLLAVFRCDYRTTMQQLSQTEFDWLSMLAAPQAIPDLIGRFGTELPSLLSSSIASGWVYPCSMTTS